MNKVPVADHEGFKMFYDSTDGRFWMMNDAFPDEENEVEYEAVKILLSAWGKAVFI